MVAHLMTQGFSLLSLMYFKLHEVEFKVKLLLSLESSQSVDVSVTWGWKCKVRSLLSLESSQNVHVRVTRGWIQRLVIAFFESYQQMFM
jgi:hypothetical protein